MTASTLIVARYILTHPNHERTLAQDVIRYPDFVKWVHLEFGVTPSEGALLSARSVLVSLAQDNHP